MQVPWLHGSVDIHFVCWYSVFMHVVRVIKTSMWRPPHSGPGLWVPAEWIKDSSSTIERPEALLQCSRRSRSLHELLAMGHAAKGVSRQLMDIGTGGESRLLQSGPRSGDLHIAHANFNQAGGHNSTRKANGKHSCVSLANFQRCNPNRCQGGRNLLVQEDVPKVGRVPCLEFWRHLFLFLLRLGA